MDKLNKFFKAEDLKQYGEFYKVQTDNLKDKKRSGKLILVTSINPTPTGEGKSTTLIGLNDCFNYANKSSIAVLRQPSIGPFFGIKGGATGSGECSILNSEEINTGFTGDFYSIETANNLIYSIIENEIYFNSDFDIDKSKILWDRCIDINDRSLRSINYSINKNNKQNASFAITAASRLMAAFCLANDYDDFKKTIENTIVTYSTKNKPIYIKDLRITDSIMLILKNAIKPNIAFSKYNSPIIIHGGPFANIAHGCNSIIATETGLKVSDYVFTEAGFGADLGAEKFLNIKCRKMDVVPSLVVVTVTLKSLKYHAGIKIEDLDKESLSGIEIGFDNLLKHIETIKGFKLNYVVILNKHNIDTEKEIEEFKYNCEKFNINFAVSTMWQDGPSKNQHLVGFVESNIKDNKEINFTYQLDSDIKTKVNQIATNVYGANGVNYSLEADKIINEVEDQCKGYYVCIAKTFSSLSDDPKKINRPTNFNINVTDVKINHCAKFVIIITSHIYLMPGLPKEPKAKS